MNFLTLSFVLFSLVLDQVLSSLAFNCATNKSIFKKKYLKETEIFKSKIDQIIGCGANFKIGLENLRQEKYKTCIIGYELPDNYTSALINLKSSDFDNATNLKKAISVVGTNYCTNMTNRFSNISADMAEETLTTAVTILDQILTQKFQLNGKKSSDYDEEEQDNPDTQAYIPVDTPVSSNNYSDCSEAAEGHYEILPDTPADIPVDNPVSGDNQDGISSYSDKQKADVQKKTDKKKYDKKKDQQKAEQQKTDEFFNNEDLIGGKNESMETSSSTQSDTRFSIGYIIIGSVILIIMIAIIIYFCTGKRTDDKVMPPPTPMKPIQSLQHIQQSLQQNPLTSLDMPMVMPKSVQNMPPRNLSPRPSSQYQQAPQFPYQPPPLQQAPPTPSQQYQQAPLNQQYQPVQKSQQYQPAPHAQQYQQVPHAQQYQQVPHAQQYQQVPHAQQFPSPRPAPYFPSQSPVQQYPPPQQSQQFPTTSTSPLQPYPSPNSQASLPQSHGSSQVGLSLEESPPSYHDVHRPFQISNPYSKQ
jgi:hypothetical protein